VYEVLPEERAAICEFALRFPKIGYRKLTWMMVDAGVASLGESTVYRVLSLIDIRTQPRHPESNGIVERFNGTVRTESDEDYGKNYLQAEAIIGRLMHHYNEERLHATLGYMTPATWHRGQPDEVRNERTRRIAAARAHRKITNQQPSAC